MRANKRIFWIGIFSGIISIIGIVVFTLLNDFYKLSVYDVFKNIFISLVGGAFLSAVTSWVSYKNIKFKCLIDFSSCYIVVLNKVKVLINLMNWHYKDIKYLEFDSLPNDLSDEEKTLQLQIYDKENKVYVSQIYNAIKEIAIYDYSRMHEILDDYTGLWLFNKNPKVRIQMKIMMDALYEYNILFKKSKLDYALYEQKTYDEYMFYIKVIQDYYKICKNDKIKNLNEEYSLYLKLSKINDYLNDIYKGLISPL